MVRNLIGCRYIRCLAYKNRISELRTLWQRVTSAKPEPKIIRTPSTPRWRECSAVRMRTASAALLRVPRRPNFFAGPESDFGTSERRCNAVAETRKKYNRRVRNDELD